MKMFEFDPTHYSSAFASQGYVHIPNGLAEEFFHVLLRQVEEYCRVNQLKDFAIGDKQQSLYGFPQGHDYRMELCNAVGAVCGLDPDKLVISERHIKDYQPDADPSPQAHKDRYATEVAVGFSIHVSPESTLVFYPHDDLWVNPFNSWAELRSSLSEDRTPDRALKDARRVEIHDSPRDVFMFRGNAIWHLRSKPAGTTMLCFKMNAFNCDPLGEDPLTDEFRKRTHELLSLSDSELERTIPLVGRRVDYLHRRYTREWHEVFGVVLWGDRHLTIDEAELRGLQAIDGRHTVRVVVQHMTSAADRETALTKIRRLAALGVIDLLPRKPIAQHGNLSVPSWQLNQPIVADVPAFSGF